MLGDTATWLRDFLRTARHTRSLRAAWNLCAPGAGLAEVRLPGYSGPFSLRRGTSDAHFLRALANHDYPSEYELPADVQPRVILDIGANIGAVTAVLARSWPDARVFAFEPLPENVTLLRRNVAQFPNVAVLPFGLGATTRRGTYRRSDDPRNFGGGGFHGSQGHAESHVEDLSIVAVPAALADLALPTIDVIKIDTEGAEHEILTSFPADVLARVQVIVGELHRKPSDAALLDHLTTWFDLEVQHCPRSASPKYFRARQRMAKPADGHEPSPQAHAQLLSQPAQR